jgi:hypothetical protein
MQASQINSLELLLGIVKCLLLSGIKMQGQHLSTITITITNSFRLKKENEIQTGNNTT